MDYTTLTQVKLEANIQTTTDDTRLASFITAVSRFIDHKLTGDNSTECHDYLKSETVSQLLNGRLDYRGNIIVNAHKPIVAAVYEMSYKFKPTDAWIPITTTSIDGYIIEGWTELENRLPVRCFVSVSYSGGLSTNVAGLPADILEAATLLTVRYWKEAQSGLADSIGVAELGQLIYTKAIPVRVQDMLSPYIRIVAWRQM